jgi:hypothetical protein
MLLGWMFFSYFLCQGQEVDKPTTPQSNLRALAEGGKNSKGGFFLRNKAQTPGVQ